MARITPLGEIQRAQNIDVRMKDGALAVSLDGRETVLRAEVLTDEKVLREELDKLVDPFYGRQLYVHVGRNDDVRVMTVTNPQDKRIPDDWWVTDEDWNF